MASCWYVYVLRCGDGSLYCGIARDVAERLAMHLAGTGAKYTRSRGPLEVVFVRRCKDKSLALRLEYAIKQLSRDQKEALVASPARAAAIVRQLKRPWISQPGSRRHSTLTSRSR